MPALKRTFTMSQSTQPAYDTAGPVRKRKRTARGKSYKPSGQRAPTRSYGFKKYSGEGPFPNKLATTLLYRSVAIRRTGTGGSGTDYINVSLNDLFDFDYSNVLEISSRCSMTSCLALPDLTKGWSVWDGGPG